MHLSRRNLLILNGASVTPWPGHLGAATLPVPTIDRLEITVLVDSTTAVFGVPIETPMIKVIPPPITRDYHKAFAGQWGYSVLARSSVGPAARITLIDFGYTPEALLNNTEQLGIDANQIDAMVLSHGHYDHFGGLDGLLSAGRIRRGTPLFVGGGEAFCERVRGIGPDGPPFGAIDRPALVRAGVVPIVSGDAKVVAGQAFTTGRIRSCRPNGQGCRQACCRATVAAARCWTRRSAIAHSSSTTRSTNGTAFNVAGRGLVVIGSCSHRGIINTVRQARAVSGVTKVHAIVGGFHLVPPQTREQALETVSLMQTINPDFVIPGHCSGETFIAAAQAAMPGKVIPRQLHLQLPNLWRASRLA